MKQKKDAQEKFNRLRRQAEELMMKTDFVTAPAVFEDPLKLIHELQTFQIELELQNDELQQSQQELMESRSSYTKLYDFAPVGYITLSKKGSIHKSNLSFSELLSVERQDLITQLLSVYIIPEDQDIFYRHLRDLSESKIRQTCELCMQKKDKTLFDVRLESTIDSDEYGETSQYRTVIIDISEQKIAETALKKSKKDLEKQVKERTKKLETANRQLKLEIEERKLRKQEKTRLEEQLRRAQKMEALGTLSSGIAHDFNNILTSIIAYTQLLEMQEFADGEYVKNGLTQILESAYQARDLVKHIMLFNRKAELVKEPLMLDLVVLEVIKMMRASLPSTIHICKRINCGNCTVFADPVQMRQVLMNLCTNAAHAMVAEGELEITLDMINIDTEHCRSMDDITPGKYVEMIIRDTGHGIIPENIHKIFDPYFTTKKPGEGTGLGLSITLGIIKKHCGAITVSSQVDQGTTFRVLVPCFLNQDTRPKEKNPIPIPHGDAVVLFVDDELSIATGVQMILEHLGYTIIFKTSGEQALKVFKKSPEKFDIVITDLTMPEMTGDTLAVEIKKIRPDIPVILCTGLPEETSDAIVSKYEVDAFIQKPYDKKKLVVSIQNAINKPYP